MAAEDGPAPEHLSFLRKIAHEADRYGVFPVLRGAEARAGGRPRIGRSRSPTEDIVELRQTPTLGFAASTLDRIDVRGDRGVVSGYWLGLTGPMGPLPLHLTEFASYERRYASKHPFGRFLDLLAGRMLQFFYRAWADSQPGAQADRPDDDRFAGYLSLLSGAAEGVPANAAFPARARAGYAGAFASRRSPAAIQDVISDLLRTPVKLLEFQPRWRDIENADRTRLGGDFNQLGGDAVLGGKLWGVSDAFRIVIRTRSLRDYQGFLPTGLKFRVAAEALDALAPSHLEWDIALEIPERAAAPARLDARARLGWTSWLAPKSRGPLRSDAHLTRGSSRFAARREIAA
ncbi:MAG TPA: type VI secretion system baseplate subunit TssG [Caulobacteraceae bacterium]|jgi:type VI secretion system protein ImpH